MRPRSKVSFSRVPTRPLEVGGLPRDAHLPDPNVPIAPRMTRPATYLTAFNRRGRWFETSIAHFDYLQDAVFQYPQFLPRLLACSNPSKYSKKPLA